MELVGERANLAAAIEVMLSEKLAEFNVELVSTSIENMAFTDAFTNAVEEKQVAQQNKLRAQTEAERIKIEAEDEAEKERIEAKGEADAKLIQAEAEAEANQKISQSLTNGVLQNKFIDSWDGKLPMVTDGGNSLINLPLDKTE